MSNSRNVPTYDKSVALQVTEQPNPEGAATMMINSFRNFAETTSAITQGITKEIATQEREILKNNISNTYRQFALDALKNPDQNAGLAAYNESSKQYAAGLMQQTNHFNRPYVSNLVDYFHNEHRFGIEKNSIAQNQRALSVESYKQINDATRDWEDAINNSKPMIDEKGEDHQFDTSRALFADQLRNMENSANRLHGGVDPATMGRGRAELIKKYQTSEYLKRYQDHVEQGLGNKFISQLQKPGFNIPGMNTQEKYQVIDQMIKIRDQGKRGARVALGQLQYQMQDDLLNIKNGGMPNQDLLTDISAVDPVKGEHYKNQQEIAQSQWTAKQATLLKSPSEKAEYTKSLYSGIDYNSPEGANQKRIADASVKAIQEQNNKLISDPLNYLMDNHPAIGEAVNSYEQAYNADAVGEQHKYTPFNSVVPKPWNSIIQEQLHLGLTLNGKKNSVRLLSTADANQRVSEINQASPEDQIISINKLRDEFGNGLPFNLVMKQFVNAGLSPGLSMLRNFDPDSNEAKDIAQAFKMPAAMISSELKKLGESISSDINKYSIQDVTPSISKSFFTGTKTTSYSGTNDFSLFLSTTNPNDEDKSDIANSVKQYAGWLYLTGKESSAQSAVKHAENTIASRYDYTKIGNQSIRMPKDYPSASIISAAQEAQKAVPSYPWNILPTTNHSDAMELIEAGHWVNDAIDNGLVWVDANGRQWSDKNGKPLSLSFEDANTVTSANPSIAEKILNFIIPSANAADQATLDLIKGNEGFSEKPYKKKGDNKTVGYGTTTNVKEGMTVSKEEAEKLAKEHIEKVIEPKLKKRIKVDVTPEQQNVLVDTSYVAGHVPDDLVKNINKGDFTTYEKDMTKYYKDVVKKHPEKKKFLKGWLNRTKKSAKLFNKKKK